MKILFLTQVLPFPLDAGPKIRIYYVLRHLARIHDITLLSFIRAGEEQYVSHLREFCREVETIPMQRSPWRDAAHLMASLWRRKPFLVARDDVAEMRAAVARQVRRTSFDWIHADQLGMAQYALGVHGTRRVLDEHNAVWLIVKRLEQNEPSRLRRLLLHREWQALRRYEAHVIRLFDQVITVTSQDRDALLSLAAPDLAALPRPIRIIPICLEPQAIPFAPPTDAAENVVCIGGMFYPPNVDGVLWFARHVLPLIWSARREVKFIVIGARPDARLNALARAEPRIVVTGYVQDPLPYLKSSAAFVVPLRAGGGMRVKILDAWARGIPVVSTTIGCEGIKVRAGENILIADTPDDFARATLELIDNPERRWRLALAGRQWVEQEYDWKTVYRQFDDIYRD